MNRRFAPAGMRRGLREPAPGVGAAAPAFTPQAINDHVWLNTTGLTLNGSNEVTAWADQVGSLNLTAAAGKEVPTTASDASFAGTRSLRFRAADTTALSSGATNLNLSATTNWSFWAVMKRVGTGTQIFLEQSANASTNPGFLWAWVSNKWRSELNAGGALNRADSTLTVATTPLLWIGDHDTALTGASTSEGVPYESNSALAMSLVTAGNATGNGASALLYVGGRGGSALYADFDLVAMGIKKTKFTASERAQMQAWAESTYGV